MNAQGTSSDESVEQDVLRRLAELERQVGQLERALERTGWTRVTSPRSPGPAAASAAAVQEASRPVIPVLVANSPADDPAQPGLVAGSAGFRACRGVARRR
jgi:hypothetical protein